MSFTLFPVDSVEKISGPNGWTPDLTQSRLNWFCTNPGPPPLQDDGNVHPSPFDIAPGSSAKFVFISRYPPSDSIDFFVHGFNPLPVIDEFSDPDSILETQPSFFLDALHGRIMGPKADPRKPKHRPD